jgi:hypothetical protein
MYKKLKAILLASSVQTHLEFSGDFVIVCTNFSADAHWNIIVNVPKTILHHTINNFSVSKMKATPAQNSPMTIKDTYTYIAAVHVTRWKNDN